MGTISSEAILTVVSLLYLLFSPLVVAANAEEKQATEIELYSEPAPEFKSVLTEAQHGDLFELIDRGIIRVAVTYSKTHYFVEDGAQHGLSYEMLREFESYLAKRYKSRRNGRALSVIAIPVARDELIEKLAKGEAELAVANLTMTRQRLEKVDFSIPVIKEVKEVIVASADAPRLSALNELSGKNVYIRESSSFFTHLSALNTKLINQGLKPANIIAADEHLEVEDLMEMANADLIDYTIVDSHIAELWRKIFSDIVVYNNLAVHSGGDIGWAVRKNTPNLIYEVNRFLERHRSGTLFGNIVKQRYLSNPYWAEKALDEEEKKRFESVISLFEKYGERYDFNHLMLLAQGYQESQLDHSRKSPVGAIGIMQLMPTTGAAMDVGNIKDLENNVHAGSKYLRKIVDHYFNDPAIDAENRVLFAFAAYNAGPTRISRLRRKTESLGLDPNIWFGNVEHTVAKHIGRETVSYVANISKYFIAYRLIEAQSNERDEAKQNLKQKVSNAL